MGTYERKKREQRARIESIKKIANRLFDEKGFENTSVDEIANAAELAKGTIYLYFKSKEELYYSLLEPSLENYLNALTEITAAEGETAEKTLWRILDFAYESYVNEPALYHLVMRYRANDFQAILSPEKFERLRQLMGGALKRVAEVISKGVEQGLFVPVDPKLVCTVFWNIVMGVIQFEENRTYAGGERRVKKLLTAATDLIIQGLKNR